MTNNDYRRINHIDSVAANRELRALAQAGLIKQHSTRRWAHYTLNAPVSEQVAAVNLSDEEVKIMNYTKEKGFIKRADCQRLLSVSEVKARYILKKMKDRGLLMLEGSRKNARYLLP